MTKKNKRNVLFPNLENTDAEREWVGMPEFVQENKTAYRTIIVHFENKKNVKKFAKLIGQKLRPLTKSIWFPKAQIEVAKNKRYVDKK